MLIVSAGTSIGMPAADRGLPRGRLAGAALEHLAHDHVLDLARLDAGALERSAAIVIAPSSGALYPGESAAELPERRVRAVATMTDRLMLLSVTNAPRGRSGAAWLSQGAAYPLSPWRDSRDVERLWRIQLVTDAALTHLDLNDLLAELLVRIRDVLGADTAAVLLRDELRNELVARAAVGLEEEVERGVRIPIGGGFAGRIAARAADRSLLDDVDHADVLNPILREKGIKSPRRSPTRLRERGVRWRAPRSARSRPRVHEDDVEAPRGRRRPRGRRNRARSPVRSRAPWPDAARTGSFRDGDDARKPWLRRARGRVARAAERSILQVDTAAVLMLDEATNELVARAAVGLERRGRTGLRIPVGGGFAGRVAAEERPIVLRRCRPR